jgi:hypothetical protein
MKRDDWMLLGGATSQSTSGQQSNSGAGDLPMDMGVPTLASTGSTDFFSDLGMERQRKPRPDAPDPEKV